jgi:molybdopterin/thiamine biosynthesis adenylyltransferase
MSKTIVVVGVGALGSHVVQLVRNVDATIRVIDFDRVEQKNVASQFHARQSVGKSKVVGLQQTMQFLFGTKIEGIPHKLVAENATQLLGNADLVIDCLDNAASRRTLQGFVRAASTACVHGALAADGTFGRVVWDEDFAIDEEPGEGAATCDDGNHLPFIATTAALIAQAAVGFLETGKKVGFQVHPGGVTRI